MFLSSFHSGPVAGAESPPIPMAGDLFNMTGSVAWTCSPPFAAGAIDVPSGDVTPSPDPLRLVRAPAASHPLPRGERAGGFERLPRSPARGEGWGIREIATPRRGLRELRKTVNDG